jgi:hypothetical protein
MYNQINPKHFLCLPLLALALTACPGGLPTPASLATQIDAGATRSDWASFDTDALGNAVVVWQQSDGTANRVYANRSLVSNHAWQGATVIDVGASNTAFNFTLPKVGLDAQGNGTAVWAQIFNGVARIYANHLSATSGAWGTPVIVDAGASGAAEPSVAVDAQGFATVVWMQPDPKGSPQVFANRWNPNTKIWEGAARVDALDQARSVKAVVRSDALGNVVAVWSQYLGNGAGLRLFSARRERNQADVWSSPVAIDEPSLETSRLFPFLAFDALGNVMVVWNQELRNVDGHVYANHYDLQTKTWSGASRLNVGQEVAGTPQVAFDALGNAIAVWDGVGQLHASRFNVSNKTWGAFVTIRDLKGTYFTAPSVVFDAANKARVTWFEGASSQDTFNLFTASLTSDTFFLAAPTLIQQGKNYNWEAPGLKRLPSGAFFTAFNQADQANINHMYAAQIP